MVSTFPCQTQQPSGPCVPCEAQQPSGPYGECYGDDYYYYHYEAQMRAAQAYYWAMQQQQQQQPFPQSNMMPAASDDGYKLWQAAVDAQEAENELVQAIVDETSWTPSIADSAAALATNSSNTISSEISGSVVDGTEEAKKKKRRSRRSAKRISRAAQLRRIKEDEEERAARAERESRRGRTYSLPPAAREDSDVRVRRIRSCSAPPVPADFVSEFDLDMLAITQEDSASSDLMSVGPSERSTGADTPDRMGIRCASSIYQSNGLSTNEGLFA